MLQTLDARLAQAHAGDLGHLEFLQVLCEDEITRRQSVSVAKRLRRARFEQQATPEGFALAASPKLPAAPDGSANYQPELLPVYVNRALSQIATSLTCVKRHVRQRRRCGPLARRRAPRSLWRGLLDQPGEDLGLVPLRPVGGIADKLQIRVREQPGQVAREAGAEVIVGRAENQ